MWNETMENNEHGAGWAGGESSFMTDKKPDNKATGLGERLPVPVTITQLSEHFSSQDDKYVIGNYRFATVQSAGIVKEITENGGSLIYTIYDPENTDVEFPAARYVSPDSPVDTSAIVEGARVRVIGKLKAFDGVSTIMLFNIVPMADDKDFTIFQLEAKAARLFFEKNVADRLRTDNSFSGMLAPPKSRAGEQNSQQSSQSSDTKERLYQKPQAVVKKEDGEPLKERVLAVMRGAVQSEEGINIHWVADQINEKDIGKLRKLYAELVDLGHIYQATDEDTYSVI